MGYKMFARLAKYILYLILMVTFGTGILWIYIYTTSVSAIRDRANDLAIIVAEENCLSSVYVNTYNDLLYHTETSWLTFPNRTGAISQRPYTVKSGAGVDLFSYTAAQQRGRPVYITLTGTIDMPLLIGVGNTGLQNNMASLKVTFTETYTVMGLKFYKDKG